MQEQNTSPRVLHAQALEFQERGEFTEALKLEMAALVAYQELGDQTGYAEIHAMIYLTLNHLHEKTGFEGYLITAKNLAMAGVELARKFNDEGAIAVPLFNLAKVQFKLEEYETAINSFREAIGLLEKSTIHNRKAVMADWKNHLAICEYKAGDKSALGRAEEAIQQLSLTDDASDYEKNVWASGAHMRIAEMLLQDDKVKAEEHLQKAKEIIDSDERLKLRLGQWEKLASKFK